MVSEWLITSEIIDKNAKKPCHRLGWCPYGKLIEEFPYNGNNYILKNILLLKQGIYIWEN